MNRLSRPRARGLMAGCLGLALALTLLTAAPPAQAQTPPQQQPAAGVLSKNGQQGVSFVQTPSAPFGSPASFASLRKLQATGATWVSVVVPFRQSTADASEFYRAATDPTDNNIARIIDYAHSLNMRVMVQPVVLSDDGIWSGWFGPKSPSDWFLHYSETIGQYAKLAQQTKADEFCIGTEFFSLTQPQYSNDWRHVIQVVRTYYFGPITYSANWGDKKNPEYATIDWWNAVDYIGISAYFPLSWNDFTTPSLAQGWLSYTDPFGAHAVGQTFHWKDAIAAVQARWNRPVQFTKIGFASYANSPGRWDLRPDPYLELSVQANAYNATMQVWGAVPWMTGIFWTPWYSDPNAGGPLDNGETPQNKPAEQVLHRWFTH